MSVVAPQIVEFDEQRLLAEAPDELRLTEGASVVPASLRESILGRARARGIEINEGEELLQIIRPGVGEGRGTRYYAPEMLAENADVFTGARMFRNHLTDKQRRELDGLPRPIEHLAGRIVESWWDGDVPADDRFEQGGVYARVKPTKFIREALDDDPDLFDTSISALATTIRPGHKFGRKVAIVEGIRRKPISVDWVTEGGAGGRALREAADQEEAVLESMSNTELEEYLAEERPELLEALREHREGDGGDESHDRRQEEDVPEAITPEALREALQTDEGRAILSELVEEVAPSTDGYVKADEVESLVESRMAERADLIRIDARGDLERQIELRDMRDDARVLVEAAKVHPRLAARITERFSLSETGEPTAELAAISSDFDEEGNLVKPAKAKLVEAVESEIADAKAIMGDIRPTRVRGQGRDTRLIEAKDEKETPEGDDGKKDKPKSKASTGSSLADELLEGAGFAPEQLDSLWVNGL